MRRETNDDGDLPLELISTAEACHKGLRVVELQQCHGRNGYQAVRGARWTLQAEGGEPPAADERPTVAPRDVAIEVWRVALETRRTNGGDSRFAVRFHTADDARGTTRATTAKFEVPIADAAHVPQSAEAATAQATVSITAMLLAHIGDLHRVITTLPTSLADAWEKSNATNSRVEASLHRGIDTIVDVIPRIVDLRLDAAEREAAAIRAEQSGARSKAWSESARELVGIVRSPIGVAMAAKLAGVSIEEASALLSNFSDAKPTHTATGFRGALAAFGATLAQEQRVALGLRLGAALRPLAEAQAAADDDTARAAVRSFFSALTDAHWSALEEVLTTEQQESLGSIMQAAKE